MIATRDGRFVVTRPDIWSMALALGHAILHLPHLEPEDEYMAVPVSAPTPGPFERACIEATNFAMEIIMPAETLTQLWAAHEGDIRAMANTLSLPATMVSSQVYRLGISSR
jgi:Zn-dependent peptidase ImmA (M78 family)